MARELIERRTANSQTVEMPDGTHVTTIQSGMHYVDRDTGQYEKCDDTIHTDQIGDGWTCNCKTGHARSRFGFGGRVRVGLAPGTYVTYEPVGADETVWARHPEPNIALYPDLWSGADLRYTKFPEGVKTDVIIHDASAGSNYSFVLAECVCVEPHLVDGALEFRCTETGDVVSVVTAPTVVDADGVEGPAFLDYADGVLTLSVDADWLADSERAFPVTLDPTTVIQPGPSDGRDTWVNSSAPTTNHGGLQYLSVGVAGGHLHRILIACDLSEVDIPPGRVIHAFEFELVKSSGSGSNVSINTHTVTETWDRATANWNTQPSFDPEALSTTVVGSANQPYLFGGVSLSDVATQWVRDPSRNYGVVLRAASESGADSDQYFHSSRYTNASQRPKFVITHRLPAAATPTVPAGPQSNPAIAADTLTPRLEWDYSSPDGGPQQKLHAQVYTADEVLLWDSGEVSSADPYVDVPPTAELQYGQLLFWRVRVYDGAWSHWSDKAWFRCVIGAPMNLEAEPSTENATIALEWTGSSAAAGYHVYRKNAETGDYARINLALLSAPEYLDSAAACGVIYDYAVVAVAENGYESERSAPVQASVIFTGTFIDDLRLEHEPTVFHPEIPFVGSSVPVLGRPEPTVHRRQSSRTLRLEGICTSRAELQAIVSRLAAPGNHRYVDSLGEVMRFEVTSAISFPQHRPYDPQNPVYFWSVTVTEVA